MHCETFIEPSDTGIVAGPGDYHIIWNIGEDVPNREFYSQWINIFITATVPGIVPGECNEVKMIAAGESHSGLVLFDGTCWSWGRNSNGQVGNGSTIDVLEPTQVVGFGGTGFLSMIDYLALGEKHSAAVDFAGNVFSWGRNHRGQLGNLTTTESWTPVMSMDSTAALIDNGKTVSCGFAHTISANLDSSGRSWGYNFSGQLGIGSWGGSGGEYSIGIDRNIGYQPLQPSGDRYLRRVLDVDAGSFHSLWLTYRGHVFASGSNFNGQLGDGNIGGESDTFDIGIDRAIPVHVLAPMGSDFLDIAIQISAGRNHSCALVDGGYVICWGRNHRGQLGDGALTDQPIPGYVVSPSGAGYLDSIKAISAGKYHTLALHEDGTIWAWGENSYGELGNAVSGGSSDAYDPAIDSRIPVQVLNEIGTAPLDNIIMIAAGFYHNLALEADGTVWAWGRNDHGQLGNGTTTDNPLPVRVTEIW